MAAHGERAQVLTTRRFGHRRILGSPQLVTAVGDFLSPGAVSGGLPGAEAAR